jgi:hypothetical protein
MKRVMFFAACFILVYTSSQLNGEVTVGSDNISVRTSKLTARFIDGVLVSLADVNTGEVHATNGFKGEGTGIRRIAPAGSVWTVQSESKPLIRTRKNDEDMAQFEFHWEDDAEMITSISADKQNGDIIITQKCSSEKAGLYGIQWGLSGIPYDHSLLIPGQSGIKIDSNSIESSMDLDWPQQWEAQFVIVQGQKGGFTVWAEDSDCTFKALHIRRQNRQFQLGLETRNQAPFKNLKQAESVRWRISSHQGDWTVAATRYREWAHKAFDLIKLENQQPSWVKDIRFVVICGTNKVILEELIKYVDPNQTLLYIAYWLKDGYDRNFPDYTADEYLDDFVKQAHELGFRVMLHVNYFGCDPLNPLYEKFKQYQLLDPFNHQLQWWKWDSGPGPSTKFAYINPASKEWRNFFVNRMTEVCKKYNIDALHLDQTLVIINDDNGLVDGLNIAQGTIALHRQLREVLPNVALSGEGLNEVTFRYEAFAQRHFYGMVWEKGGFRIRSNRYIEMAHPVASWIFLPYTTVYGYLGMANPDSCKDYRDMRRVYEPMGVIPTIPGALIGHYRNPSTTMRNLLTEAKFFQEAKLNPDLSRPLTHDEIFRYTGENLFAAYVSENGSALMAIDKAGRKNVVARCIEGVYSAELPGTIPGWITYDKTHLLGLDPDKSYDYDPAPRDMKAFHVEELPADITAVGASYDRFAYADIDNLKSTFARLWEFDGKVISGYRLYGKTREVYDTISFNEPKTGAIVAIQGQGVFAHVPYQVPDSIRKTERKQPRILGTTFIDYYIKLPLSDEVVFTSDVCMLDGAVGKTDGVTFRVSAELEGKVIGEKVHNDQAVPKSLNLDLSGFAGKKIKLRLEVHPGPNGNTDCDWALFARPMITTKFKTTREIIVVSPQEINRVISNNGAEVKFEKLGNMKYRLFTAVPTKLVFLFEESAEIQLPTDITKVELKTNIKIDGAFRPPFEYTGGRLTSGICKDLEKHSILANPPDRGQTFVNYLLALPETPSVFEAYIGIHTGSDSQGVEFIVEVLGQEKFRQVVKPNTEWQRICVDLSDYAGKTILLSLITDSFGTNYADHALWGEPKIIMKEQ